MIFYISESENHQFWVFCQSRIKEPLVSVILKNVKESSGFMKEPRFSEWLIGFSFLKIENRGYISELGSRFSGTMVMNLKNRPDNPGGLDVCSLFEKIVQ